MPRAVALFGGGLDGALALRLIERQGVVVEPVWVRVPCGVRETRVLETAARLQLSLTILPTPESFGDLLLAAPRTGQGERPPCRDCRVAIFRQVRRHLEATGADFAISGEVLGQEARTQRRRDLDMIAIGSGLDDRLVRPLSAQRLETTQPERRGWLDRAQLLDLHGEGRRGQLVLAGELGVDIAWFSRNVCALCEATLAAQLQSLRRSTLPLQPAIIAALRLGRVTWLDRDTVVVLSRRASEAVGLRELFATRAIESSALLESVEVVGPTALVIGRVTEPTIMKSTQDLILNRIDTLPLDAITWRIEQHG